MVVALAALVTIGGTAADRPYLEAAQRAAVWIDTARGASQEIGDPPDYSLYSGDAGILLFKTELASATRRAADRQAANQMAALLAGKADHSRMVGDEFDPGLYTGGSGLAFALARAGRKADAQSLLRRVGALTSRWDLGEPLAKANDIISGTAGIGCALLWAAKEWKDPAFLAFAEKAGYQLLTKAERTASGWSWPMDPTFPRLMPNFSHGTAGVAYFFARLYEDTKKPEYLEPAKQGAAYLSSITSRDGLIYHHEPDGKDLFYLGWCHGPVGTSRLFDLLHKLTKDKRYAEWTGNAATTLSICGLPEKRGKGYWNNYGLCCGDAGMLRFYLDLYRRDRDPKHLAMAKKLADFLIAKGEKAAGGLRWTFAENRVSPDDVKAQTGLMQGAAGIGLSLLWLDALLQKRVPAIQMPDAGRW